MNKKEFIDALASKAGKSKAESAAFVDAFVETVVETLKKGESVKLIGFGNFEVRERKARKSRNPKTGEVINVPASKAPAFKVGAAFKNEIKG